MIHTVNSSRGKRFVIFHLFPQICNFLNGATVNWIDDQKVPYAVKGNEWVGFDTKESYDIKVSYRYVAKHTDTYIRLLHSSHYCSGGKTNGIFSLLIGCISEGEEIWWCLCLGPRSG